MLKQLTEALASDDLGVVKTALREFIRSRADALIVDACYDMVELDLNIINDGIIARVEEAIRLFALLGDDKDFIRQNITNAFVEYGKFEEDMNDLWEELDDDTYVLGTS